MQLAPALGTQVVGEFLDAVVQALRAAVGFDAVVSTIDCVGGRPPPTIVVVMELEGDVRGPITWVFPPEVAVELVRRLLADPDPSPDTATDGAAELANILTGRAAAALEDAGFRCAMGPPVLGESLPTGVAARLTTSAGPIDIVLALS